MFHDSALVHDRHPGGIGDVVQVVGDFNDGGIRVGGVQPTAHLGGEGGVEVGGELVKHQHPTAPQKRLGQGQSLPLTPGKRAAALPHRVGQPNLFVQAGHLEGGQQVGVGGGGLGQPEVVGHGGVHGPNVLGDYRHGGPEGVEVVFPVVTAVDKHSTIVNVPIA